MKRLLLSVMFSVFVGLGSAAYLQDPGQARPPEQKEQGEAQNTSFTGCLTKGTAADEYMIADQESGQKIAFTGSAELEKYVNQTVKVTGKIVVRGGERTFTPEKVEQVASSCEAKPKSDR